MMEKMRKLVVFGSKMLVSLDETNDAKGRCIAYVIIGTLEESIVAAIFYTNLRIVHI